MKINSLLFTLIACIKFAYAENLCEYFDAKPAGFPLACKTVLGITVKLYNLPPDQALHCENSIEGCRSISRNNYTITTNNATIEIRGSHFLSVKQKNSNNNFMMTYDIAPTASQLVITNVKFHWEADQTEYTLYWDDKIKSLYIDSKSLTNRDKTYVVINDINHLADYDLQKQYKCKVQEEYLSTCFNAKDAYDCTENNTYITNCKGFNTTLVGTGKKSG